MGANTLSEAREARVNGASSTPVIHLEINYGIYFLDAA